MLLLALRIYLTVLKTYLTLLIVYLLPCAQDILTDYNPDARPAGQQSSREHFHWFEDCHVVANIQ
jgi:hypothetical protein